MLKIRLFRVGKKKQPAYKIVVTDRRNPPSGGRFREQVGTYNPLTKQKTFNQDRIKYWLSVGAQPSDTVHNLLVKEGIVEGKKIDVHKKPKEKKPAESPTGIQAGKEKPASAPEGATAGKPAESPADIQAGKEEKPIAEKPAPDEPKEPAKPEAEKPKESKPEVEKPKETTEKEKSTEKPAKPLTNKT